MDHHCPEGTDCMAVDVIRTWTNIIMFASFQIQDALSEEIQYVF